MAMQEIVSSLAIDRMRTVKEFNLSPISDSQLIIVTPNLGVFECDPLVHPHAIIMASFNHERPRGHQKRQFCIIGHMSHIPFEDFVFAGEHITEGQIGRRVFGHPFIVVRGTD